MALFACSGVVAHGDGACAGRCGCDGMRTGAAVGVAADGFARNVGLRGDVPQAVIGADNPAVALDQTVEDIVAIGLRQHARRHQGVGARGQIAQAVVGVGKILVVGPARGGLDGGQQTVRGVIDACRRVAAAARLAHGGEAVHVIVGRIVPPGAAQGIGQTDEITLRCGARAVVCIEVPEILPGVRLVGWRLVARRPPEIVDGIDAAEGVVIGVRVEELPVDRCEVDVRAALGVVVVDGFCQRVCGGVAGAVGGARFFALGGADPAFGAEGDGVDAGGGNGIVIVEVRGLNRAAVGLGGRAGEQTGQVIIGTIGHVRPGIGLAGHPPEDVVDVGPAPLIGIVEGCLVAEGIVAGVDRLRLPLQCGLEHAAETVEGELKGSGGSRSANGIGERRHVIRVPDLDGVALGVDQRCVGLGRGINAAKVLRVDRDLGGATNVGVGRRG